MELKVQKRETLGKKVKNLREEGLVPAEVYGRNFDNIHISVPEKKFMKIMREEGTSSIIDLQIDGDEVPVLVQDVQNHPISRTPLSIDFYRIREDEEIQTTVPLEFVGEAPIAKDEFIVVKVLSEVEIESLPREIPSSIEVDISGMEEEDDLIRIEDLPVPEEVEVLAEPDTVVVSITEQEEEEEEEAAPIMPGELGELGEEGLEEELFEEGELPEELEGEELPTEEGPVEGEGEGEGS